MKDEEIKNKWEEFITDYQEYFKSNEEIWLLKLNELKNYINKNNEKPSSANKNNEISYVVHQYDRFNIELRHKLNGKYGFNFL